jgi:hypothetical protein
MARFYAGTLGDAISGLTVPPKMTDSRIFGAKERQIIAAKNPSAAVTQALAIADDMILGRLPSGAIPVGFRAFTDTTLGTATLSIGITGALTKYVNAATLTATNIMTELPMVAAGIENRFYAAGAEEELIMTIGVAGIAAGTKLFILPRYQISA